MKTPKKQPIMLSKKELLEETGYEAVKFEIKARNLVTSGGMTSEKSTLATAEISIRKRNRFPLMTAV